jgi:APA family basic amino acid/polyamine antiporter
VSDKIDNRQQSGLVRTLGPIDATMIVIGSMIGSGIFITSAESSRLSGAPGWLLLAWAVAGLLTITGALCCSELATMMPRAGGVYVFLREAYGHSTGFLYGWTLFLVIQTGTIAAVAIAFAKFLGVFVVAVSPENYLVPPISLGHYAISLSTEQLVAIGLIALLTWSNTRGLEVGKIIQNTFTFAKTAALVAVVVIGLSLGWKANSAALGSAWWDSWANGWSPQTVQPGFTFVGGLALALLFGKSMVGPLFAQTAWTNVTFIGSEVRDPGKNLVRALVIGCGSVVILYLLANLAYVAVLPFSEIEHAPHNRVAVAMMNTIFGRPGAMCMAAAIMISTFGCNNGLILSGARVYYAMRDRLFFKGLEPPIAFQFRRCVGRAGNLDRADMPRTVTRDPQHNRSFMEMFTTNCSNTSSQRICFYILMVVAVMILRRAKPCWSPISHLGYPFVLIISVLLADY